MRHLAAVPDLPDCGVCGDRYRVTVTGVPGGIPVLGARAIPCPACTDSAPLTALEGAHDDDD